MPRVGKIWKRKGRPFWYATINGVTHNLGTNKKDAQRKFHKMKSATTLTVADSEELVSVVDQYLVWVSENRAEGTLRFYKEHGQMFCRWLIDQGLDQIDAEAFRAHQFNEYLESLKAGRRNGAVQAIKRVYNWAVQNQIVEVNPLTHVEKPRSGSRKNLVPESAYLKIVEYFDGEGFGDLIRFAWHTGARPQEIWKLTADHIDHENQRLVIPTEDTKRRMRQRSIYCDEIAWIMVMRNQGNSPRLFLSTVGKPWDRDSTSNKYQTIERVIGHRYAIYDFRHTWITKQLLRGMSIYDVAELAGTSVAMIEKHYSGVADKADHLSSLIRGGKP